MVQIHTEIEINASPEVVRARFLDFKQLANYHESFIKSVNSRPSDPQQKEGKDLLPGDKLIAVLGGLGAIEVVVTENTREVFIWRGKVPGAFTGHHFFHFKPSATTPGGTTFEHGEDFTGNLVFLLGENWFAKILGVREDTIKKYAAFNVDLKAWCEKNGGK